MIPCMSRTRLARYVESISHTKLSPVALERGWQNAMAETGFRTKPQRRAVNPSRPVPLYRRVHAQLQAGRSVPDAVHEALMDDAVAVPANGKKLIEGYRTWSDLPGRFDSIRGVRVF